MFIPDCQVKPGDGGKNGIVPLDHLEWAGRYAADKKPDVIVIAGDWYDMPSLSSYDAGRKSAEGRRYQEDIEAGNEGLRVFEQALKKHSPRSYRPRKVVTLGNHECVSPDTEILTSQGWIHADRVSIADQIASYEAATGEVSFSSPVAVTRHANVARVSFQGDMNEDLVSETHRIDLDGKLVPTKDVPSEFEQTRLRHAGLLKEEFVKPLPVTDDILRTLVWTVCDGTVVLREKYVHRIQFKLSKPRKIERLRAVLEAAEIPYTFKPATMSGLNKLQPFYIRIYGVWAAQIWALLGGHKLFDTRWRNVGKRQWDVILPELVHTDGSQVYNHVVLSTVDRESAENLQILSILSGAPCKIDERENRSGFGGDRLQYLLSFFDKGLWNRRYVRKTEAERGDVIAIASSQGTLVTRRMGRVSFTGNSRITRAVEENAKLEGKLSLEDLSFKERGWTVYPFLQPVKIHGINYCHFFPLNSQSKVTNSKNGSPSALAQVRRMMSSAVAGHKQGLETAIVETPGATYRGVIAGSFYLHEEKGYIPPIGEHYWKGLLVFNDVRDGGNFELMEVSMNYLSKRYG